MSPLLLGLLVGCTETSLSGPDLGACAAPPAGAYTYGEVGIGSCLSGPVDLEFVERNGRTWLAIANADPFRNFSGGSILLLDWADTVGQFDSETLLVSDIASLTIDTEHFIGGLGWLQDDDKNLLLVTRRFSEGARTRTGEDSAYIFDLDTGTGYAGGDNIPLKDDPGGIAVASDGTVYILNYTDHSVSVLDASGEQIIPIDLAPEAALVPFPLDDADASGSVAEFDRIILGDETRMVDDAWTLTWLPGQFRAWAVNGAGFERWDSGGGTPVLSGIPGVMEPNLSNVDEIEDAMVVPTQLGSVTSTAPFTLSASIGNDLSMLYSSGGAIFYGSTLVVQDGSSLATLWNWTNTPLIGRGPAGDFDELRGGPSIAIANGGVALYYDVARSSAPTAGSIAMAVSIDGINFSTGDTSILSPAGTDYTSYEQPFVQVDDRMNVSRMWLSMYDGFRYVIGYSQSDDGLSWSEPVPVITDFTDFAAPVVRYVDGEYLMWAATRSNSNLEQWTHVLLRSADGISWGEPEVLFDSDVEFDLRKPPRLAVATEPASSWRVEGVDSGNLGLPAVAGLIYRDVTHGFEFTVASGHEIPNDELFPNGLADLGIEPGSHYDFGGIDWLYVTHTGADERPRISALESLGDSWNLRALDLIPAGTGGNIGGVHHPVVREFDEGFVLFYSAVDGNGVSSIQAATSANGNTWFPAGPLFESSDALGEWAGAAQEPRSIEVEEDGTVRIWLGGSNGSRYRIGAIVASAFDPTAPQLGWELEPGEFTDYQLAPGPPGSVDDSGAKDPMVLRDADGRSVMYYSAYDGSSWHLAYAVRDEESGQWMRRVDVESDETLPAMSRVPRTFSAAGVDNPVARLRSNGQFEMWYAGRDLPVGGVQRLGRATGRGPFVFPEQRRPTLGDSLAFQTQRGDDVVGVIELAQDVETFLTTGVGTTGLILDEQRGMLYIPSKLSNLLYVIDIRDDTRVDFVDQNAMDVETLIRLTTVTGSSGYRGGVISPSSNRLYLTTRNPEAVLVVDLTTLIDDDEKEVTEAPTVGSLPMQDTLQDAGADSVATIGGGHPAIATVDDDAPGTDELLLVPHFRDNSLSVFDLGLGAYGAEIAYLPYLGENPHLVRVSPDGRWAVVAVYLGDVDDEQSSSTLAIVDLDPNSATYLQATNWIRNR